MHLMEHRNTYNGGYVYFTGTWYISLPNFRPSSLVSQFLLF